MIRGDAQSGRVGEPLTDPLVVEVTDSRSRPVAGAGVNFAFASGGTGADVVPHTATTDANGLAQAQIVLGTTVGTQTGQAEVVMTGGQAPKTSFTAIALSESANSMAAVAGEDQTGRAGAALANPLVVKVTDAFGNPISGVTVTWAPVGGGSVSDASTTTDDQGRASVVRTLGAAVGQQSTVATSAGLAGSPVTFAHTALAGNASTLAIVSGDGQTGLVGSRLPADLVVRLIDANGNGVPGTAVTWVVAIGGGGVSPANSITDGDGRASAQWTVGTTAGANRLDAVVSGVGVVSFHATATAAAPATLFIRTQPSSTARNGIPFARQPVVQLRDAGGNDVATAGIQVAVAIGAGGGSLTGTRQQVTDANGRAGFTDLAIFGATGTHTLVFSSPGFASAPSSEIDVSAIPTSTTITSDAPDPSIAGAPFTVGFRVTSEGPTPAGSVTVTVSDEEVTCTGALTGGAGSCNLVLAKTGDRRLTATYSGAPGLNPSSGTESHRVNPQNQPPHADFNWHCSGLTCQFTDASSDPDGSIATRSWNFGDGGASTDKDPSHTFPAPGTYNVTLTVTDNAGASNALTAGVTVNAPPPPPNKAPTADFDVNCANLTCTFTDKSKDADGSVVSWHWDFGDTQSSTDQNPSHTYSAAGTYHVTLTVTDNGGLSDSKEHDAHPVAPPPPPPAATTTTITSDSPDPSAVNAPITVTFTVTSGSGVPSGNVTVSDGTDSCTGSLAGDGTGNCLLTLTTAGSRTLTATYPGNASFSASWGTAPHTVDQPPNAVADNYTTTQDVTLTVLAPGVLLNDTDPDGTPLTAVPLNAATTQGSVSLQTDGSFTYTPNPGFIGSDTFTYAASDGFLSSTATVTISVTP